MINQDNPVSDSASQTIWILYGGHYQPVYLSQEICLHSGVKTKFRWYGGWKPKPWMNHKYNKVFYFTLYMYIFLWIVDI
jgi:hypothetical protein